MTVEWKSDLNIYDPMQILQKNHDLLKYLSFHSLIHRIRCIEFNLHIPSLVLFRGSCKFFRQYHHLLQCCSYHSIDVSAKLLHCRDGPGYCSKYFFIDNRTWWYLLSYSSFLPTFSALFYCNKFMSVSFNEAFALSCEIVLGSFLKITSRFKG